MLQNFYLNSQIFQCFILIFQSDASGSSGSSVLNVLGARRVDAESVLLALGFGPSEKQQKLQRIPDRFLIPSKVSPGIKLFHYVFLVTHIVIIIIYNHNDKEVHEANTRMVSTSLTQHLVEAALLSVPKQLMYTGIFII